MSFESIEVMRVPVRCQANTLQASYHKRGNGGGYIALCQLIMLREARK